MNILHFSIGLPPARRGGSVQYAFDLMREQVALGHKVYALTCGDTLLKFRHSKINKKGRTHGIHVYTLSNPLTPTLIYGVSNPEAQYKPPNIDFNSIRNFITSNGIEIFHIHTFQGLHQNIVSFIKSLGVKIIYTSHDFHGICPHYDLIDFEGKLCSNATPARCVNCNMNEPSERLLRLANSSLYHFLKNRGLKKTKVSASVKSNPTKSENIVPPSQQKIEGFQNLLAYYRNYFQLIDQFHFNSSQTKRLFNHFLGELPGKVIPVLTRGITDKRQPLSLNPEYVTWGYIGNLKEYKGFPILKRVLMELFAEGIRNFRLKAYGSGLIGEDSECPNIEYLPPYDNSQISKIMYHLDGTIVPSKWYETFSLVTLESLAHGRPAIVSDHVGAQDIVRDFSPEFVFSSEGELKNILKGILQSPEKLIEVNKRILDSEWKYTIRSHAEEMIRFYKTDF